MANYTKLKKGSAAFSQMMKGFAVTTVMNARVYEIDDSIKFEEKTAEQIRDAYKAKKPIAFIDSLKVANITIEGPTKTITGGQYANPIIKFGKTARIEMQDALGRADVIEAFGGAVNEYLEKTYDTIVAMHSTSDFASEKLIIGESFFIDKETGYQVKVDIIFYKVLPDSIFNLTQDSEGDATVFDMNGDLLTTDILLPVVSVDKDGVETETEEPHGVFYSVVAWEKETYTEPEQPEDN